MNDEYNGIERRLDELSERLTRLETLQKKPKSDFDKDAYLRDIVERNSNAAQTAGTGLPGSRKALPAPRRRNHRSAPAPPYPAHLAASSGSW